MCYCFSSFVWIVNKIGQFFLSQSAFALCVLCRCVPVCAHEEAEANVGQCLGFFQSLSPLVFETAFLAEPESHLWLDWVTSKLKDPLVSSALPDRYGSWCLAV